jgi:hypothetical protein
MSDSTAADTSTVAAPSVTPVDTKAIRFRSPEERILVVEEKIKGKQSELDNTRKLLGGLNYDAMPDGQKLKISYEFHCVALGKDLMRFKTERTKLIDEKAKEIVAHAKNQQREEAKLAALNSAALNSVPVPNPYNTPRPASQPPDHMALFYGTKNGTPPGPSPPVSPSIRELFKNTDYSFVQNQSQLRSILQLATQPINWNEPTDKDFIPKLPRITGLATLDPVTTDEIRAVAHEFHLVDLNLLECREKLEVMKNPNFIAKVTRTRQELQINEAMKDNVTAASLAAEFQTRLSEFQKTGTQVVLRYTELEQKYYRSQAVPVLLRNMLRLSKTFVTRRCPQAEAIGLMDLASDVPEPSFNESTNTIAGYVVLLTLTLECSHALCHWTGLQNKQAELFAAALNQLPDTPLPYPTKGSATLPAQHLPDKTLDIAPSGVTPTLDDDPDEETASSQELSQTQSQDTDLLLPPTHEASQTTDEGYGDDDDDEDAEDDLSIADHAKPTATVISTKPKVPDIVLIGNTYFPMLSKEAWDVAVSAALDLQPILAAITLERRAHLLLSLTRSKMLAAVKKLTIKREILHATSTVAHMIRHSDNSANHVVATMQKWRRDLFEKTRKQTNGFLYKHRGFHTARATNIAPTSSSISTLTNNERATITIDDSPIKPTSRSASKANNAIQEPSPEPTASPQKRIPKRKRKKTTSAANVPQNTKKAKDESPAAASSSKQMQPAQAIVQSPNPPSQRTQRTTKQPQKSLLKNPVHKETPTDKPSQQQQQQNQNKGRRPKKAATAANVANAADA